MIRKILEALLIAVILVGGVLAWRSGRERSRLSAEYARLAKAAGDFTITDPTRIHVLALETDEPLHYAWRVYLPPHSKGTLRTNQWSVNYVTASSPEEFIARVRIRQPSGKDRLQIYQRFEFAANTNDLGGKPLATLLQGHEAEIEVEQLGSGRVAVLDPDRSAILLRLALPPKLQARRKATLEPGQPDGFSPNLVECEIIPDSAKAPSNPSGR